jgi:NAD(P) transhydrogenase subunit alpha
MAMTVAVPREIRAGERRVAATPETVGQTVRYPEHINDT